MEDKKREGTNQASQDGTQWIKWGEKHRVDSQKEKGGSKPE